ncbi:MAG TPA: hypothetical protein VG778_06130 [Blastocatellia bacterium]|jgi:hypothetical protein|nr:hypothetical protein [Blastocatellia bacterium]
MIFRLMASLLLVAALSLSASAQSIKVETIGAFDKSAAESVRASLEAKGYRVSDGGSVICEIWLRNNVPVESKRDVSGGIYTELGDSTVVGVVSFPAASKDYRGQGIAAGVYTLRYAMHPTDGNHMGISPYRDFLLLVPAASDPDINAKFKFEDLAKISGKAAGTNHPTPFSLVSTEGVKTFPSVSTNDHGHVVLAVKLKTQSGAELPIAFIVKGVAEQ